MSLTHKGMKNSLQRLTNHNILARARSQHSNRLPAQSNLEQDKYVQVNREPRNEQDTVPLHTFMELTVWNRPDNRQVHQDWQLLQQADSYKKLVRYMTAAVLGKVAQPVYGDYDVKGNTDNNWWFNSDRWRLLVLINRYGLVTFSAQEGME